MYEQPLIGCADWHLVDGSMADDACVEGIRWSVETAAVYRPVAFAWLGDMVDRWLQPDLSVIIARHKALLAWIDAQCALLHAPIWYLRGNHEGCPAATVCDALRTVMTKSTLVPFENVVVWNGWSLMHGHQLDPMCHGFLSGLAAVGTNIAGVIERVVPGFQSEWLDPTAGSGPQRMADPAVQNAIHEAADDWARENQTRLLHGHTHRRRISLDRQVVCAGTCQGENKGEFAAVWPDGLAILNEMRPAA